MAEKSRLPVPLDPVTEDAADRRLWIGNLDPRVTEFVLLKLLQRHGAIEKFDLLFHRSGPLEGQPRGYAFVTYSTSDFAKAAQEKLDGKFLGNKALCVKWACSVKKEDLLEKQKPILNIPALAGAKSEKKLSKMTTIQAIEAKLKAMEETSPSLPFEINEKPSTSAAQSNDQSNRLKIRNFDKQFYRPYLKQKLK